MCADVIGMTPSVRDQYAQIIYDTRHLHSHLLGIMDGQIVGTVTCTHESPIAGMWNGITLPAYRRRGILTALMQQALTDAKQQRQTHAMALLMPKGMARGPCQRLGFVDVSDWPFYAYGLKGPLE